MNESSLDSLRQQVDKELQEGIDLLRRAHRVRMAAIDVLERMSGAVPSDSTKAASKSLSPSRKASTGSRPGSKGGWLTSAVLDVVDLLPAGGFDLRDVVDAVCDLMPERADDVQPSSVSNTLKRLERDGVLTLVSRGRGNRPSVYKVGDAGNPSPGAQEHSKEGGRLL